MRTIIIQQSKRVQEACKNLSRNSSVVYEEFKDKLLRGNSIPGERQVPQRSNQYHYRLSTGEHILYSVVSRTNWRGEPQETILIEDLFPGEIVDFIAINSDSEPPAPQGFIPQVWNKIQQGIELADNINFRIEILIAAVIVGLMLWSQFIPTPRSSDPIKPTNSKDATDISK